MRTILILIIFLFMCGPVRAIEFKRIHIVSSINNGIPATSATYALSGDTITLSCILEAEINGSRRYYSNAGLRKAQIGPAVIDVYTCKDEIRDIIIKWLKIEPYMMHQDLPGNDPEYRDCLYYTNAHFPWCNKNREWIGHDKIEYKETSISREDSWTLTVDACPSDVSEDVYNGLGTMRYKAVVSFQTKAGRRYKLSSAGKQEISKTCLVVVRKNNSLIGWMCSYFNVPGVFGSIPDQVESYTGVDCADLIVAAYNRTFKKRLGYSNVAGLIRIFGKSSRDYYLFPDGTLRATPNIESPELKLNYGKDLSIGDIIFFDYPDDKAKYGSWDHIGALYEDKGPDGSSNFIVDGYDEVIHAGPREAHISRLDDEGFVSDKPTRIRFAQVK